MRRSWEEKAHRAYYETTKTFIEWNAKLRKTMMIIIIIIKWIWGIEVAAAVEPAKKKKHWSQTDVTSDWFKPLNLVQFHGFTILLRCRGVERKFCDGNGVVTQMTPTMAMAVAIAMATVAAVVMMHVNPFLHFAHSLVVFGILFTIWL